MPSGSCQVAPTGQTFTQGGLLALLALHRHVELALLGHRLRVVVGVGVLTSTPFVLVHLQHPDPLDLRIAGLVVLLDAGVDAAAAADAAGRGPGRSRTARPGMAGSLPMWISLPYFCLGLLLQAGDDLLELVLGELPEVVLEERLHLVLAAAGEGGQGPGHGGRGGAQEPRAGRCGFRIRPGSAGSGRHRAPPFLAWIVLGPHRRRHGLEGLEMRANGGCGS